MREVRKILLAGGQEFVDAAGDFVFCSFADRPFRIVLDGQPVTVRAGDKLRPEKRFQNFLIENLDTENPIAVTLVVGEGDYNSQIIQGEVTVQSGIRKADGQWINDSRSELPLRVMVTGTDARKFKKHEYMALIGDVPISFPKLTQLDRDRFLICTDGNAPNDYQLLEGWPNNPVYTELGTSMTGLGPGCVIGRRLFLPFWIDNAPLQNTVGYRVYSIDTLELIETLGTDAPHWGAPLTPNFNSCATDGRYIYQGNSTYMQCIDPETGTMLDQFDAGTFVRGVVAKDGVVNGNMGSGLLFVRTAGPQMIELPLSDATIPANDYNGNPIFSPSVPQTTYNQYDQTLIIAKGSSHSNPGWFDVYSLVDRNVTLDGHIANCAGGGIFRTDGKVETNALVSAQVLPTGRVIVSGQVLRAALEIYLRRFIPNDYLDFIYAVTFENESGIAPRTISSGGQSFKAAGIDDAFSCEFPQRITITLREGLI